MCWSYSGQWEAWISTSSTPAQVQRSLLAWWEKGGQKLVKERFAPRKESLHLEPEEVECLDGVFEDEALDVEDLEPEEVQLNNTWQDLCGYVMVSVGKSGECL